jgi:hypothetical protein
MRIRSLRIVLSGLIPFLIASLSSCGSIPDLARPSPSATPAINRDRAIELAIGYCRIPHLVLIGEPTNIQTKLLAVQDVYIEGGPTNYGIPMDTMVWQIQMDGQLQLVGGPAPVITPGGRGATPTPPQPFWGTCTVIIDANSGRLFVVRD